MQLIPIEEAERLGLVPPGSGQRTGNESAGEKMTAWAADLEKQLASVADEATLAVQQQREEQLEVACAKMVQKLQKAAADAPAATPPTSAAAKKKEAASFGSGLAKGFFGKPKDKKRKGAAKKAVDVRGAADKPGSEPCCAPCAPADADKENTRVLPPAAPPAKVRKGDRCACCNVRLPITAVVQSKCRCGELYCSAHMHSHTCTFDYKTTFKDKLRHDTPVVAPAKLPNAI